MTEDEKKYIELYPSYWIYNAGLVGIIRTLKDIKAIETEEFLIGNGEIKISQEKWNRLPEYYVEQMSKNFSFFESKEKNITNRTSLTNNSSNLPINDIKFWFNIFFSKNGLFSNRIDIKNKINKNIGEKLNGSNSINMNNVVGNFRKNFLKGGSFSKKTLMNFIKKEDISKSRDLCLSIQDIANEYITSKLIEILRSNEECNKNLIPCSFCEQMTNKFEDFSLRIFNLEGGSTDKEKGFPNFYWSDSTQLPICGKCQLVLFFSPLGIFPDSNTYQGEFINIPDIKSLWDLNNYRIKILTTKTKEKWLKFDERSKLIDTLVSSGAYLQLKSRWLLQNIEIIEIGGNRKNTVYSLNISPNPLYLLSDYSSESIVQWLNQVEDIKIRAVTNVLYKKSNIYTNKWVGFTKGKEIIEKFLNNDTGWIVKISIMMFKLYFEEDIQKNPLNDFEKLIIYSLKPLLLLNLSLLNEKESYSEFYKLGKSISGFFEKKSDDFKKNILPSLFNSIYTLRKTYFLEIIMRVYMKNESEINETLLEIFKMNDIRFQTESLLFIVGTLEKLESGDKNE